MRKIKNFLLALSCIFLLTGCEVYVYNFDDTKNNNNPNNDTSSNLTQSGTGTTIVDENISYSGEIKYTDEVPTTQTAWSTIYDKVKSSVVTVRNIVGGSITSTGSGVFFAEDMGSNGKAYIFTNAHVVKGATSIEILLSNDILVNGSIVGYDNNEDVAVVQIDKRNDYTIATLRNSDTLNIGEEVLAVGSPLGDKYAQTATSGIISNLNIALSSDESSLDLYLIQVDAALNPGNSGGPLFDNNGNLIGINTMKLLSSGSSTNLESFNYAIPISHFSLVAKYLLQGSLYYRPFLNITIMDIRLLSMQERQTYGITVDNGLLITNIGDTSPLKNKVNVNQVITKIEDIQVLKSTDFSVELIKHAPNSTISITVCDANGNNSKIINDITLLKRTD